MSTERSRNGEEQFRRPRQMRSCPFEYGGEARQDEKQEDDDGDSADHGQYRRIDRSRAESRSKVVVALQLVGEARKRRRQFGASFACANESEVEWREEGWMRAQGGREWL